MITVKKTLSRPNLENYEEKNSLDQNINGCIGNLLIKMCNVKSSNLASRLGSSIRAPEGLDVLLLMDRRCNGGVKVTEAANDVAP